MALETASYIAELVATNPLSSDPVGRGDDHLRLLKSVLQATFPNLGNGFARNVSCSAGYTVLSTDNTGLLNVPVATGATITHTVSLPAIASVTAGFYLDLHVPGPTDVVILTPTGGTSIEGSATFTFGPESGGRIFYDGATWRVHQYPLTSNGTYAFHGAVTISGATHLQSTLSVSGAATLGSTLTVSGAAKFLGAVTISGATHLQSTLSVSGATTLGSTLSVSGAAHMKSTLSVGGATTLGTTLTVSGASHLQSTLSVGGATTLGTTLTVSGAAHLQGALSVGGAVTLGTTLTVSGAAFFNSTVTISGTCVAGAFVAGNMPHAWVALDMTGTLTARDSYNVSSLTDTATGRFRVNFTNNAVNADYATAMHSAASGVHSLSLQGTYSGGATDKTATGATCDVRDGASALQDSSNLSVTFTGGGV